MEYQALSREEYLEEHDHYEAIEVIHALKSETRTNSGESARYDIADGCRRRSTRYPDVGEGRPVLRDRIPSVRFDVTV